LPSPRNKIAKTRRLTLTIHALAVHASEACPSERQNNSRCPRLWLVYGSQGKRWWFRLHEKGGKRHEVPAHHLAEEYLDAYLVAAGIGDANGTPLFRSLDRKGNLTERRLHRLEVLAMVKRRARRAALSPTVCCHTFRATGITAYLENGGTIEHAQQIAAHESPRTTKLYDRTGDTVSLDEIEKIII
jgi:integrase/recombinase XerD